MRMRAVLALLLCAAVSATTVSEQRVLAEMEAEMKEKGISIPFYGNWCGPGYPKPGENPKTIDKVDLACKHHDQCYSRKGYFDCGCNTGLMREIPKLPSDCKSALCKKRYGQIMAIFRNMFCVCRNAQASLAGFKWKTKAFTVFNPSKCTATARFAARRTVEEKKKGKKKKKSTKKKKKPAKKRTTKKTKGKKGKGKTPKGKKPKGKKAKAKKAKGNKTKGKKAKGKKSKKAALGKKKKKAAAGKKKKSAGAKKKEKKKKSKDAKKKEKKKKSSKSESSSSASSTNKKKIEKVIEKAMTAAAVRSAAQATCNGLSNFLKPKHARGRSRMLGSFHKSGNADADYAAQYFSDLLKKKVKSVSPCAIH